MRQFLWKGSGPRQGRRQAWDITCRPIKAGGLGILDIQNMSMTLLTKWVAGLMSSFKDLVIQSLKESYGRGLDWEKYTALVQGVSPFWQGLRHIFGRVRLVFVAQLGNSSSFQY